MMLGVAIFTESFSNRPEKIRRPERTPKAPISKPIVEEFKRGARRIGGEAFPSPKIKADKIAREPSINSSDYSSGQKKTKTSTFLMHRPLVEDITTIVSGNKTVTIIGIKPLSTNETCKLEGKIRPCGMLARTALRGLIRGRTLKCKATKDDQNHATTSCKVGNIDIAEWLVKRGWTTRQIQSTSQSQ